MDGVKHEDYCVTIPLLINNEKNSKGEENHVTAATGGDSAATFTTGNSSFFNTCFNGLNALSDYYILSETGLLWLLKYGYLTSTDKINIISEDKMFNTGVGILSVPYALASGGWLSLLMLFIIAISAFYTGILIKRCMDADSTIRSYPDIGERAFGKAGRIIVTVTMNIELYLVATGFLILEGDNLSNILPEMDFDLYGIHVGGKKSFVVIVAAIILPTIWLNSMSILSYVSASGVLASLIILGSIWWVGEFDGVGFQEKGKLLNLNGFPSAISLYAFCYCAHPVFPTLYTSMRNQKQFSKVLLLCFVFCTITYSSMAVVGYLMFGTNVQSQITLNLPTEKISSRVAICTTLVNPIAKYALMVTPIMDSIEERFLSIYNTRKYNLLIRTALVISTVIVAIALPFFRGFNVTRGSVFKCHSIDHTTMLVLLEDIRHLPEDWA
ncbi:amino acid transporter, transmembrane domain-containing protein [Artemisia annua]|uniref:Amino acid transporter, transmembrane domain-containing protein n=1 Tax=Artemisia annua TaxID=35608 RepID=A0A2U1NXY8_ARTAN|nr:amino acid transporter, transmembrane domain-containing protein [Artemisia annua]